jgi:hypothetical protein
VVRVKDGVGLARRVDSVGTGVKVGDLDDEMLSSHIILDQGAQFSFRKRHHTKSCVDSMYVLLNLLWRCSAYSVSDARDKIPSSLQLDQDQTPTGA